jgi:hypothetical protein
MAKTVVVAVVVAMHRVLRVPVVAVNVIARARVSARVIVMAIVPHQALAAQRLRAAVVRRAVHNIPATRRAARVPQVQVAALHIAARVAGVDTV